MKRAKMTNVGSNLKPSKRSKAGISCDETILLNGGLNEEVINRTAGQTFDKAENLSSEKKKPGKRKKVVKLEDSMINPARKKRKVSANSGGPKTLLQGDSTLDTTPKSVEKKSVTNNSPIPVIVGLQCHTVTASSKKAKKSTSKSFQKEVEPGAPQSDVLLISKATDNQERNKTDGDTVTKKKRGRPFGTKSKSKRSEISLAVNHQNGVANAGSTLPLEKSNKPEKVKQVKRRMISLNTSSPQDVQDSSKQKESGNSEINVEKSLDTESDDQPLSRWLFGKHSSANLESTGKKQTQISKPLPAVTNSDGQTLTFEKRSKLWETIESMEAFRFIPQKPHFSPLKHIKESARERYAINKMVDFSGVFEETRRLRIDHPRTEIEDQLEALLELETHGFDVGFIRNRLMELISLKDKQEGLESRSKEVKDSIEIHRVDVEKLDKESKSIDKRVTDLLEKRDRVLKEKEKKDSEIVGLEAELDEVVKGMREYRCIFDELATASIV